MLPERHHYNPAKLDSAKPLTDFPVSIRAPVQLHAFVPNITTWATGPPCTTPILHLDCGALRPKESLKHNILPHIDLQVYKTSILVPRTRNLLLPPPAEGDPYAWESTTTNSQHGNHEENSHRRT